MSSQRPVETAESLPQQTLPTAEMPTTLVAEDVLTTTEVLDPDQKNNEERDPDQRNRRNKKKILALGAAVVALTAATFFGLQGDGNYNAESPGFLPTDPTEQEAAIRDALTVNTVSVDCVEVAKKSGIAQTYERGDGTTGVKFDVSAIKPVGNGPDERRWSDALSTPFQSNEDDNRAMLTELQASLCEDPLLGSTLANLFAEMEVRGIKVLDLNPWLREFAGDPGNINDVAASYITLREDNKNPTDEQLAEANKRNKDWEKNAEYLATLLERFMIAGVGEGQTILNFHLLSDGLVVPGLPEVGLNLNQMRARAFRLILSEKPGTCVLEIDFNIGDKRLEQFECIPLATHRVKVPITPGTTPETIPPKVPPTPPITTLPPQKGLPAPTVPPATVPPTSSGGGSRGETPAGGISGGGDSGPGAPSNNETPPPTVAPPATAPEMPPAQGQAPVV